MSLENAGVSILIRMPLQKGFCSNVNSITFKISKDCEMPNYVTIWKRLNVCTRNVKVIPNLIFRDGPLRLRITKLVCRENLIAFVPVFEYRKKIQINLDLRNSDLRKNLDLRMIVATTNILVYKLLDLRKIF